MKKIKNIAIIPARKNSKGYKNKNRIFFDLIAKFVKKLKLLDEVIVSSNDDYLINNVTTLVIMLEATTLRKVIHQ